ncbi:MAG TPA: tRNA (adenosine(37)-N6)-threonylcarbamoyltransferase complex dimerization subunit type 1 TsaB [Rhodanobacteraceae bacterium]|nr:tRNA (adenosine(37)-N6)-threonylcarbamoyltransferase complex dimerization subunit type 1 TsaB [Rhodanobacteraceae bacterium]
MNLLAIETATECCSVALVAGARVFARSELAPRRHAELLLPMCDEVLAEAGLARRDLDVLAVGRGPGAFTGVRLAVSAAQGIALALGIPVVPVSSLAALAMQAPDNGADVLAVIDARMGEVYAGLFRRNGEAIEAIGDETVGRADALRLASPDGLSVVGTGWLSYRGALEAVLASAPRSADGARYPQAADVARLALPLAIAGEGIAADRVQPVYLRDKVALTLAEQQRR